MTTLLQKDQQTDQQADQQTDAPQGIKTYTQDSSPKQRLALEGAHNARDLGGYPTADGCVTSEQFLRADCFMPLSEGDKQQLLSLDVRTVIDLRNLSECVKVPSGLKGCAGVSYFNAPVYPEREKGNDGREWSKVPADFTMGMLYVDILENHQEAIRDFFICAAQAEEGRILFHCSAGKDRTGVIAALLLKLCGVSDEIVVADYALTEVFLADVLPLLKEASGTERKPNALEDEIFGSRPANMEMFLTYISSEYGDVPAYLSNIGVSNQDIERIKTRMTAPASTPASIPASNSATSSTLSQGDLHE